MTAMTTLTLLPAIISIRGNNLCYVDICIQMPPPHLFIATFDIAYSKLRYICHKQSMYTVISV